MFLRFFVRRALDLPNRKLRVTRKIRQVFEELTVLTCLSGFWINNLQIRMTRDAFPIIDHSEPHGTAMLGVATNASRLGGEVRVIVVFGTTMAIRTRLIGRPVRKDVTLGTPIPDQCMSLGYG